MIYELGSRSILFKYLSILLKNNYNSDITVSDEYSLDLAKFIYKYLNEYYPVQTILDENNNELVTASVADYYLFGTPNSDDIGAMVYETEITKSDDEYIRYNRNKQKPVKSIYEINKYNVASWTLKDSVIQYLYNGIVISNLNQIDEIAQVQELMRVYGYKEKFIGEIDNDFILRCYRIQESEKEKDITIVKSGYFDKTVEFYLRGMLEVTK